MRRLLAVLALLLLTVVTVTTSPANAKTRNPQSAQPLYLVMDVSGSMEGIRLEAARDAARSIITGLQQDQVFALYTFPGGRKVVDTCPAGRFNIRPERADQGNAQFAVNLLSATGNTPTVPALKEIMRNVKNNGFERAQVVLVTDGEANCGDSNDVCTIVPLLDQQGIKLRINTVSLNNTPAGDASLACLAQGTGGTATTVDDIDELVAAVRRSSSYAATLDVEVPETMSRVTGRARELAPEMSVTVTSVGSAMLPDASLIVTFTSGDAARRVELDPIGVLPLGNIEQGMSTLRNLTLYPMATSDGPVTWKVSVVSGGIPVESVTGTVRLTSGTTLDTAGSILRDAQNVVILGDSYSSGEGGGDYDSLYPSRVRLCHRSANAYGRVLFKDATMLACSGGLTTDLTHSNSQASTMDGVEPQLYELLKQTASDKTPDLVLMTLGGNDSGFASIVSDLVWHPTSDDAPAIRPPVEFATLRARLVTSYRQINAIVNAPVAIAKRDGKVAQIVVLPYVRPMPAVGGNGCFALISDHELALSNQFVTSLNDTVRAAINEASNAGVPIQLASPVEYAFEPDHTICDADDSWVNAIRLDDVGTSLAAVWRGLAAEEKQQLMHPTVDGYRAVAASVIEWSRTASPKPLGATPMDYKTLRVWMRANDHGAWGNSSSKLGDSGIKLALPDIATEPGQSLDVSLCIEACEFGSMYVTVTTYSTPIPLGALPVSPDTRRPEGRIVLPEDLPPGRHTILLRGYDSDGRPHEAQFVVNVWRPGSNRGIYLAGLGAVLLVTSGTLAVVRRLRRADHA